MQLDEFSQTKQIDLQKENREISQENCSIARLSKNSFFYLFVLHTFPLIKIQLSYAIEGPGFTEPRLSRYLGSHV